MAQITFQNHLRHLGGEERLVPAQRFDCRYKISPGVGLQHVKVARFASSRGGRNRAADQWSAELDACQAFP